MTPIAPGSAVRSHRAVGDPSRCPCAGAAAAHRPAAAHGQVHELGQAAHAVDVVAVVDDDLEAAHVDLVEATWRLEEGRAEGPQPLADVVKVRTGGPGGTGRGQRIGDVHPRAAFHGGRDEVRVDERHGPRAVAQREQLALVGLLQHHGRAAALAVPVDAVEAFLALLGLHREVDHVAARQAAHPRDVRIVGVEHRGPGARHGLDEGGLDAGQLRNRVDAVQAEVVGGDVGDHGHVVAVVAEPLAQDAAARDLEDGGIDAAGSGAPSGPTSGRSCRPS